MISQELLIAKIRSIAEASGIDPNLFQAICTVESSLWAPAIRFEPHYKWLWFPRETASRISMRIPGYSEETETALQRFSYGPCQLMGAVFREYGYDGFLHDLPTRPEVVLEYGIKHLKKYMQKYPTETDWIAAWNAGSPRRTPGGLYENQKYVDKVCGVLLKLRALK